ncbi:MAG TPA: hypothetical protein VNA13_00705 [Xanthomonadales bacterium]|nr:hypothetical protein [Xanthomonadales bacterium]
MATEGATAVDVATAAARAGEPRPNATPAGVVEPDGRVKPARRFFGAKDVSVAVEPDITTGVKRREVSRSGSTAEVGFSAVSRGAMADRIRERLGVSQELFKDKARLDVIDRILLKRGEEIASKIDASSELTRDELALAWTVIQDDLRQKASAAKMAVDEQPEKFQKLKDAPVIGGIFRRYASEATTRVTESDGPRLTTEAVKTHGITEWNQDAIAAELRQLNELRADIEGKLGFGTRSADRTLPNFDKQNGDLLHDSVVKSLSLILERKHLESSLAELRKINRVEAASIEQQAIQEGLMRFAQEQAKALLIAERPDVDIARIQNQLDKINKPADQEEVDKAHAEAHQAIQDKNDAQTRLDQLTNSKESVIDAVEDTEEAKQEAKDNYDNLKPILSAEIKSWEARLDALPEPTADEIADKDAMRAYNERDATRRKPIVAEIDKRHLEIRRLLLEQTKTDYAHTKAVRKKDALLSADDTLRGSLAYAKKELTEKEVDLKKKLKAEEKLKEPAGQKANKKRGLEIWKSVMERDSNGVLNYEKIISTGFAQGGDEARYTQDQFADTTATGGTFVGAELLRESIFGVIKDEWVSDPKNKALIRKMLSDEAIGRGIVRIFSIDTTNYGLANLLPQLANADQAQIGDLTRFLISEGLRSAEKGDPFLKVSERYAKPKARIEHEALGILEEEMGVVKLENMGTLVNPRVIWEGPVREAHGRIFGSLIPITHTELNFRVTEEFNRGLVIAGVQIEVNEEFLKYLPVNVSANMPEEIRRYFYDSAGAVRTELRQPSDRTLRSLNIPEWITISDPAMNGGTGQLEKFHAVTSADMLNALGAAYSSEIPRKLATQTANKVLDMPPAERKDAIKGLPEFNITFAEADTGNPINCSIRFDNNGIFWISDGGEEMQLEAYYTRREENYRGDRQTLESAEREALQQEMATIQEHIGMRILENQQYK